MKNIYWFSEVGKDNIPEVGGKGANLGEMSQAGFPIPPGFIISAGAYQLFLKKTGLLLKINKKLKNLDPENSHALQKTSSEIQKMIISQELPAELKKEIIKYYKELSKQSLKTGDALVAVRSSATAEDLPSASFAGQQATFLNIRGEKNLILAVERAIASLYTARAIYYRIVNKFDHTKVSLAVPVQKMIESEVSGIMFTADPVSSDETKITIDAGFGLGEAIVSGSVTPDNYAVDKKTFKIIKKDVHEQEWKIIRKIGNGRDTMLRVSTASDLGEENEFNLHVNIPKSERGQQKLSDDQIIALAKIGKSIEDHYGKPQDTEFAIEKDVIYIVQARPITTLNQKTSVGVGHVQPVLSDNSEQILKGTGASMGMASGVVKILNGPSEINRIEKGDVLVAEMTTPDYVPAMRRAVAIVTDAGGKTSHAAIVSRELGIPCVVGTGTATHTLKEGMMITVDGAEGVVYRGKIEKSSENPARQGVLQYAPTIETVPVTGTKVYVNLGEPDRAKEISQMPCDGVGLMRAEFIISEIGEHPSAMIKKGKGEVWSKKLADGIAEIAEAFSPRPVVYRASDFKSNEYRGLKGGTAFEQEESNPMIGYRGEFRYITNSEVFKLEIEAIRRVREKLGLTNLWLMIPFVRTIDEFRQAKKILEDNGLKRSRDFKLWIMAEVPSVAILMEEFCHEGIDGVSIGSNDLTQLVLGIDRDNEKLTPLFDERNEAVVRTMSYIITTCRKNHITCSICGQAPSNYPEIVELFVKQGATSVSVSADKIIDTRKLIASIEKKILLENAARDQVGHFIAAL